MITIQDLEFMKMADLEVAQKSNDRSSRVGCVMVRDGEVVMTGHNSLPRGCRDIDERHERPEKYGWFVHAEPNTIINAAREGIITVGCNLYLNWYPCDECSGFVVQAGIKKIYCDQEPEWDHEKWGVGFKRARQILKEGGVEVVFMNYEAHRQGLEEITTHDG